MQSAEDGGQVPLADFCADNTHHRTVLIPAMQIRLARGAGKRLRYSFKNHPAAVGLNNLADMHKHQHKPLPRARTPFPLNRQNLPEKLFRHQRKPGILALALFPVEWIQWRHSSQGHLPRPFWSKDFADHLNLSSIANILISRPVTRSIKPRTALTHTQLS